MIKVPLLLSTIACLLVIGCSSKESLDGKRESISVLEDAFDKCVEIDTSKVLLDKEFENKSFPQAFLNSNHSFSPLKLSSDLSKVWLVNLDYSSNESRKIMSAPVVAEGKIFCLDAGGIVYAIHQESGEIIWRLSTTLVGKDGQLGGAVAYYNGRLIVTSCFSECFSIDVKTGKISWRIKLPYSCKGDGISVHENKGFILCGNSSLHVINLDSGKLLWSHSGTSVESSFVGSASVAVDNGIAVVAYPSGEIYALLSETGMPIWDDILSKTSLTNVGQAFVHPRACPVLKDGVAYVVAANQKIVAFDVKTGKRLWSSDYGGVQTPSINGNSIFLFNSNSELVCLNRENGKLRWKTILDQKSEILHDWYGQILVSDHVLMLSPNGRLLFVSVYDGKIKKIIDATNEVGSFSTNPIVVSSAVYMLTNSGELIKYK